MNKKTYSIGLDIHGVIDDMPDFFAFLSNSIINSGGEIHIITGSSLTKELIQRLNSYNIKWTHFFSIYDYLIEIKSPSIGLIQFPDGTIQTKFTNKAWDEAKAEYCRKNKISLHIDDTLSYNEFFTTPFAGLDSHIKKSKISHKDINI